MLRLRRRRMRTAYVTMTPAGPPDRPSDTTIQSPASRGEALRRQNSAPDP